MRRWRGPLASDYHFVVNRYVRVFHSKEQKPRELLQLSLMLYHFRPSLAHSPLSSGVERGLQSGGASICLFSYCFRTEARREGALVTSCKHEQKEKEGVKMWTEGREGGRKRG